MSVIFDNNGHAVEAGNIRVYYYDSVTHEYVGWSDEYIHIGVSMPGNSTDIDPGIEVAGKVAVFNCGKWQLEEDHRGKIIYSTNDRIAAVVDYIGVIKDGFTTIEPTTIYDKWNGSKWIIDQDAKRIADSDAADVKKKQLIDDANNYISGKQWPSKLALGRLTEADKEEFNKWLDYIDELDEIDTSNAPDINWPNPPNS